MSITITIPTAWLVLLSGIMSSPLIVAVVAASAGQMAAIGAGFFFTSRRLRRNGRKLDEIHAQVSNGNKEA